MQLLAHVLALWSVIATIAYCQGGLPMINTPFSCRAPLPIEWFINNTQTASALSLWASSSLATASKNLSSYIQSQLMVGDTVSVIIGTPWGPISEMNFGKLRSNTTGDNQTVNSQSLYRVASTTKIFTVLELLILQQEGKLSLFDSPRKYIPELNISSDVTLELLAAQMSGLRNDVTLNPLNVFPGLAPESRPVGYCGVFGVGCSDADLITAISDEQPSFEVDVQPAYSDDAFSLLGQVIVEADGRNRTYEQIIEQDIFAPLNMTRSFFVVPPALTPEIVIPNNTYSALSVDLDFGVFNPTGGLFTTVEDYNKFLYQMFLSNTTALITRATGRRWLRSFFTNPDFVTEVGMPWEVYLQTLPSGRNTKVWGKSGGIFTFHAYISVNTDLGFSVVVFHAGNVDESIDITVEAHKIFAPVFENIILQEWNISYGGKYVTNGTIVDIAVNLTDATIELTQLEQTGVDALGSLGYYIGIPIANRSDILSYLWPGIDVNTFRFSLGSKVFPAGGTVCTNAWFNFDQISVNGSAIDEIKFIKHGGKKGVTYAPLNLTAWRV